MITTLPELRAALEMHYGRREVVDGRTEVKPRLYDEVTRRDLSAWLMVYQGSLQALFDQVTLDVSVNYGRLPDKAQLARAAERIKAMPVYLGAPRPEAPSDDETDAVVEGLTDIVANLGRKRNKTVERREPYSVHADEKPEKPVEKGHAVDPSPPGGIRGPLEGEGAKQTPLAEEE